MITKIYWLLYDLMGVFRPARESVQFLYPRQNPCALRSKAHPLSQSPTVNCMRSRAMGKPEYRQGPEVAEKFEEAMKLLFRTPKPKIKKKQPKAATSRKLKNSDKD